MRPKELFNTGQLDRLKATFKEYQRLVQAELDRLDMKIQNLQGLLTPFLSDSLRGQLIDKIHALQEEQTEWLNFSYGEYLKLLHGRQNQNLGWKIPGA